MGLQKKPEKYEELSVHLIFHACESQFLPERLADDNLCMHVMLTQPLFHNAHHSPAAFNRIDTE